jgi:hypothetical protein
MTYLLNWGNGCDANFMSQIAKSTNSMTFDILSIILTAHDSDLPSILSIFNVAFIFIYRINQTTLTALKHCHSVHVLHPVTQIF